MPHFLLLPLLLLLAGCASGPWRGFPTGASPKLVWPAPPEAGRVAFVMQIRSHEDLFQSAGFWRGVGELIGGKPDSALVRPYGVALHPGGGLLVADPGRPCVHFYDWTRRRYVAIGPRRPGGLPLPVGVAGLADGRILVCDSRLGSVEAFDRDGRYLGPFCAAGALERPAGIAASAARGEVYVADAAAHCVRVFDLKGAARRTLGGHGNAPGQFNYPAHLALDAGGRLVVSDTLNYRVQVLTPDGAPVSRVGEPGDAPGKLARPKGAGADGAGNLIVIDGLFDALQFFNPRGELLLSLGASGHAPGEFWLPAGLCYDPKERLLFVADSYNKRVQVFRMMKPTP